MHVSTVSARSGFPTCLSSYWGSSASTNTQDLLAPGIDLHLRNLFRCPLATVQFLELSVKLLLQGCPRRFVDVLHLPWVLQLPSRCSNVSVHLGDSQCAISPLPRTPYVRCWARNQNGETHTLSRSNSSNSFSGSSALRKSQFAHPVNSDSLRFCSPSGATGSITRRVRKVLLSLSSRCSYRTTPCPYLFLHARDHSPGLVAAAPAACAKPVSRFVSRHA